MDILIIRHGIAGTASLDSERCLTEQGKERLKTNFEKLKLYIPSIDYIFSSPLVRTKQTSEILKSLYDDKPELVIDEAMAPGSRVDNILDIAKSIKPDVIAFVGHLPDLFFHINDLMKEEENIEVVPGSIHCLKFNGTIKEKFGVLTLSIK